MSFSQRAPSAARQHRSRPWLLSCLAALSFAAGASAAPPQGALRTAQPQVQAGNAKSAAASVADGLAGVIVQPAVQKALAAKGSSDYVIELRERADLSAAAGMDWNARGRYVVEQLRNTAERSQAALRRQLANARVDFEPHWIKNVIVVRDGNAASVRLAASNPAVARIREMPRAQIVRPQPGKVPARKAGQAAVGVAENIAWIGADQAWAQGTRGHGVTVGVIDTGAYHVHQALRRQYRGWLGGDSFEHDYNWFDPVNASEEPTTHGAHGTHVTGTIVGDDHAADPELRNRIGVAPGAKWVSCLGLTEDGDNAASLLSCGEFMLAPTRVDGTAPDPDKRPQVINNSWSENTCNGEATSFYADVIDAWVASGIFPVFAAGNTSGCGLGEPPGLSSISSPASLAAAFAVGSTGNHDGLYATHSLWGPTVEVSPGLPTLPDHRGFAQLKPQVVAPGVDIVSAYDGFDGDYGSMTGTSMSAPHIAGLVALMLEAGECLAGDYATLGTLVMATARPVPYATGGEPAPGPGDIPNYATGWGEIDAAAAVDAAAAACGPQGFVAGVISDAGGAPVGGARVELFTDENVRIWELFSEPDGSYIRRLPENLGSGYTLRVSAYGFVTSTQSGLTVADDSTTTANVQLATAPLVTVQGTVTDATTGWPLHARLRISGYPHGDVWTDVIAGSYSVQLPVGASYRVDVDSDIAGYVPQTLQVAVSVPMQQDVGLLADTTTCQAPGYAYTQQWLTESFEVGTPPAGWSTSSAGQGWIFGTHAELDDPDYWPIPARDGRFAATIDRGDENSGNDARFDYLVSPPIDLSTATQPVLRFDSLFFSGAFLSKGAYVQASIDDGASWTAVGAPQQDMGRWRGEAMSLAAFAGQTVRLRFHYDDGSTDDFDMVNPGWAVDEVAVLGGCAAPAGGALVVGHVRDANTGTALDGAVVSIDAETTVTAGSNDPAVGGGFFALHAAAGNATVSASRGSQPAGYGDDAVVLAAGNGQTLQAQLALPAGLLAFNPPGGPSATVELGTVATVPFTLRNDGTLPLDYAFEGQTFEQHFEDGMPPAGWTLATSGDPNCPWRLSPFANSAGGDGESAGVYAFDCFQGAPIDSTMELPAVDLSGSAHATLGFFLALHQGPGSDSRFDVEVSTDAGASWNALYTLTGDTWTLEPANLLELDLAAHVGEPDVRIRFRYRSTPPWGDVQVDQVHVFRELGVDDPLAIAPAPGTLAAGEVLLAEAEFDATRVAQPGTYVFPIRVGEDTPYPYWFGDQVGTMTVTAPASFGSVAGAVRSLGRCDANPEALAGVPVRIVAADGSESITHTDATGGYRYWLEAAAGPYTVEVVADGHATASAEVALTAGSETTANLDARPSAACVVPDPVSLQIAVAAGDSTAQPFDLLNLGAADGDYAVRVGGDPAVPSVLRLSQNTASEPEPFYTAVCFNPPTGHALETHWYRVYTLSGRGLGGSTALVDGVRFGADSTSSAAGTQPVRVSLHRLDGALLRANMTLLASTEVSVADTALGMLQANFDAPVEVPLDATLVVELSIPDGDATGSIFYAAGNSAADTAPAYFSAPDCGLQEPTSYDDIGFDSLSTIIDLDIRASDACGASATPVQWLGATPATGTVPADDALALQALVDATGLQAGSHAAALCITAAGPVDGDAQLPVQLDVGPPSANHVFADGFE